MSDQAQDLRRLAEAISEEQKHRAFEDASAARVLAHTDRVAAEHVEALCRCGGEQE